MDIEDFKHNNTNLLKTHKKMVKFIIAFFFYL